MNKRQRKKARRRWIIQSQWMEYDNIQDFVRDFTPITASAVHDPHSWMPDDGDLVLDVSIVSPSQKDLRVLPTIDRGFGRCFSGNQSRRDLFPSPYLPDGSENPRYGAWLDDDRYHG